MATSTTGSSSTSRTGARSSAVTARATARIRQRATTNSSGTTSVPVNTESAVTTQQVERGPRVAWSDEIQVKKIDQNYSRTGGLRSTLRSTVVPNSLHQEESNTKNQPDRRILNASQQYSRKETAALSNVQEVLPKNSGINHQTNTSKGSIYPIDPSIGNDSNDSDDENNPLHYDYEESNHIDTVEDLELTLEEDSILTDATSIYDQTRVMIRSHFAGRTLQMNSNSQTDLSCSGLLLGKHDELFTVSVLNRQNNYEDNASNNVLRYGDRVILRLSLSDKSTIYSQLNEVNSRSQSQVVALGARKIQLEKEDRNMNGNPPENMENTSYKVELCSFDEDDIGYVSKMYQWTVLRYRRGIPVRLGNESVKNPVQYDGHTSTVGLGEPVLFRHVVSGGIMSCTQLEENGTGCNAFKLRLLTDSYDANRISEMTLSVESKNGDPTYLSHLQQSNLLIPSDEDVFYFFSSVTPPTPLWVIGDGKSKESRPYIDGTYMLTENKDVGFPSNIHPRNVSLSDSARQLLDQRDLLKMARRNQLHSSRGQEEILVDEVIGSFLGCEGVYVKVIPLNIQNQPLLPIQFKVQYHSNDSTFQFDAIVSTLVDGLLQLSTSYVRIRHFVLNHYPGYEYGCVMQAMCECLDLQLQDYIRNIVATVERQKAQCYQLNQQLTLSGLSAAIYDFVHMMHVLENVCSVTITKKGGDLINSLGRLKIHVYRGDSMAEQILQRLLEAASLPYINMLQRWLECGELCDPHLEFMIKQNTVPITLDDNDAFYSWESQYDISSEHILEGYFATKLTVEQVLATGRYWNALRACSDEETANVIPQYSKIDIVANEKSLSYTTNAASASSYVQNLYNAASRKLLKLLMIDFDLMESLQLMKRYFLLEHGDFFVNFLDVAEGELLKDLSQISRGRVQHWLNASVQLTEQNPEMAETIMLSNSAQGTLAQDNRYFRRRLTAPAKLRCKFATASLTEYLDQLHASTGGIDTKDPWTPLRHSYSIGKVDVLGMGEGLSGLEAFVLEFSYIPFPISLVLSPRTMAGYQLLFRHLFFAKHVERRLVSIWQDHQFMKELQSLRGTMGPTFLLRQRMLHFLQNLIYYMMFEVIEPNWIEMEDSIKASKSTSFANKEQTVDDILKIHNQFLQRALDACLLTNRELVRALTKLMRTCLLFTEQMKRFLKATKIEDDRSNVADEMQKVVQRNLNERRIGTDLTDESRKILRETMQKDRLERQQRVQRQTIRVQREVSGESYQRMVRRFEEVFSDNLREFMALLTHSDDSFHTHKVNLCIRLDYNGFVGRTTH